jgi:chromosome segregation ATPase
LEPLLSFAEELERRDAEIAGALAEVERLRADVEELRKHAGAAAGFLASLPALTRQRDADVEAAAEARAHAASQLHQAESELEHAGNERERLAAERSVQHWRDEFHDAEVRVEQARAAREQLDRQAGEQRAEADSLAGRAAELAPRVRDVPPPAPGLEGASEWGSRARGALLVQHSGLAAERDKVVREASELVASVLGEPLLVTGVAGVRDRLERALRGV